MTSTTDCLICAQEDVDPELLVFADEAWSAGVVDGYDVPGWVVLRIRDHAEGYESLPEAELANYGRRCRDVVGAVRDVTGAPAVYTMVFGEANPHFHVLIAPRGNDVPIDRRTGAILALRYERADVEAARRLVPEIRAAYRQRASAAVG